MREAPGWVGQVAPSDLEAPQHAHRLRDEVEVLRQGQYDGYLEELHRFRMDDHSTVRGEEGGDLLLRAEGNRLVRQAGCGARQEDVRVLPHSGVCGEEQVVAEERGPIREITRPQQRAVVGFGAP